MGDGRCEMCDKYLFPTFSLFPFFPFSLFPFFPFSLFSFFPFPLFPFFPFSLLPFFPDPLEKPIEEPAGEEAGDVGEDVGKLEGAANGCVALQQFNHQSVQQDDHQWDDLPDALEGFGPSPEQQKGKSPIHAHMDELIGMRKQNHFRQVAGGEQTQRGDEDEVGEEKEAFDQHDANIVKASCYAL